MSTFAIVVLVLAVGAIGTFIAMKTGKVKDLNNNNIPDAIEDKIAEAKVAVNKVKAVAEKVTKVAKTVVVEKKATKKAVPKKTK